MRLRILSIPFVQNFADIYTFGQFQRYGQLYFLRPCRVGSVFRTTIVSYFYLMWSIFPHAMFFFSLNLSNQYKKGSWGARLHPMQKCFNMTSSYNFHLCMYILLQCLRTSHTYMCPARVDTSVYCRCLRTLLLISWFTHQTSASSISIPYWIIFTHDCTECIIVESTKLFASKL